MHVEATTAGGSGGSSSRRRASSSSTLALRSALLWLIVVTGAAVRVTDSGLGCRHWPGCEQGHPLPAKDYHAFIEFGNRPLGGVDDRASLLLAALAALRRARRCSAGARRLALAIFARHARAGAARLPRGAQTDLHWPVVAAHLLLSMVVLAGAVVLALEALRRCAPAGPSRSCRSSCAALGARAAAPAGCCS